MLLLEVRMQERRYRFPLRYDASQKPQSRLNRIRIDARLSYGLYLRWKRYSGCRVRRSCSRRSSRNHDTTASGLSTRRSWRPLACAQYAPERWHRTHLNFDAR